MTTIQIFALVSSLLALGLVFVMLRRRAFRERHAVWWVLAALAGVVLAIFPGIINVVAVPLGVADPVNLVFFGSTIILFLMCVQLSSELTSIEARVRRLAEETAMHDARLTLLEDARAPRAGRGAEGTAEELGQARDATREAPGEPPLA